MVIKMDLQKNKTDVILDLIFITLDHFYNFYNFKILKYVDRLRLINKLLTIIIASIFSKPIGHITIDLDQLIFSTQSYIDQT